jgi:WD40 repeat protein
MLPVLHALALTLLGLGLQSAAVDAQKRATIEIVPQIDHAGDVTSAAFSRDGAHILTASADGTLKLWDIATTGCSTPGAQGDATAVALCRMAPTPSGSKDKTIRSGKAIGRPRRTIYAHLDVTGGEVSSVAFSPDGKRLLSSSGGEDAAKLWDAETGRLVRMFQHAKGSLNSGVTSAVFSPDGTRMATGGAGDKIVNLWNTETGQLVQAFGDHRPSA